MYAAIFSASGEPQRFLEGVEAWRDALTTGEGYRGGYLLADAKSGKFVTFNLYETESEAYAYETSGQMQRDVDRYELSDAKREVYEVVAQRPAERASATEPQPPAP